MSVDWNGINFDRQEDLIYIGDKKIDEIWNGNIKIYPLSDSDLIEYLVYNCGYAVFNNEIHFLGTSLSSSGGVDLRKLRTAHVKYNGSKWVKQTTLPIECMYNTAFVMNGKLSYIYRVNDSGSGSYVYLYTKNKQWELLSTFHSVSARVTSGIFVYCLNNKVYYFYSLSNRLKLLIYYNNTWAFENLPSDLYTPSSIIFYNNAFHIFGYGGSADTIGESQKNKHYIYSNGVLVSTADLPFSLTTQSFCVDFNNGLYFINSSICIKYFITNNTYLDIIKTSSINIVGRIVSYNSGMHYFYRNWVSMYKYTNYCCLPFRISQHFWMCTYNNSTYILDNDCIYRLYNNEWVIDKSYPDSSDIYTYFYPRCGGFEYDGKINVFTSSRWFVFNGSSIELKCVWTNLMYNKDGSKYSIDPFDYALEFLLINNDVYLCLRNKNDIVSFWKWDGERFNYFARPYYIKDDHKYYFNANVCKRASDGIHIINASYNYDYKITTFEYDNIICERTEYDNLKYYSNSISYNGDIYIFDYNFKNYCVWNGNGWADYSIPDDLYLGVSDGKGCGVLSDGLHVYLNEVGGTWKGSRDLHLTSNGWVAVSHYAWSYTGDYGVSDVPPVKGVMI